MSGTQGVSTLTYSNLFVSLCADKKYLDEEEDVARCDVWVKFCGGARHGKYSGEVGDVKSLQTFDGPPKLPIKCRGRRSRGKHAIAFESKGTIDQQSGKLGHQR